MGLQVDSGTEWFCIDFTYFLIFLFELVQRAVLTNQLQNYQDDTLVFGLFGRMEFDTIKKWLPDTIRNTKNFMRDRWIIFDTVYLRKLFHIFHRHLYPLLFFIRRCFFGNL